ncbi:MAG: glycoside hydrolase family 127 protein, partial [Candidatus Aminicenantes bacterium]|nr:glycoside hydrolase family 127 protein [Candidatus Aminicenantes bacterium]
MFFCWWLKKGTKEWVEYTFDQPYLISGVQVYWLNFDHYDYICRPPRTWKILYRQGDRWVPVRSASPYSTEINRYNSVTFSPVKTTGLKIVAQFQKDYSAGIME